MLKRSRLLLIGFALLAPLLLGGCDEELCGGSTDNALAGLVVGFLCLGHPDSDGGADRTRAEFEITPSVIASGETVTLDATRSHPREEGTISAYNWDVDGEYTVSSRGRFFDFEVPRGGRVLPVQLFRRDPAFVRPPGEIIDNGDSETRLIALTVVDTGPPPDGIVRTSTAVGRVTITGEPRPPGPAPLVASFKVLTEDPVVGGDVVLDATASAGVQAFSWDLDGDGNFETGPSGFPVISTKFATPGLHTVRLRVSNNAGLTAVQPREIFVRPAPQRGSGARARAATATPVSARLAQVSFPADLGRPRRAGRARVFGPIRASGRLIAAPRGLGEMRPFRRSSWDARVRLVARPSHRAVRLQGVAQATFPRRVGKACLRLRMRGRAGRAPTGRLKVIGGTGKAAELKGVGRFRFRFEGRTPRLHGRLSLRTGPSRPLPRACAGL